MGKCVGVCKLVGEVCIGCGRNVEEIRSTGYKKEIAQLKARIMELEALANKLAPQTMVQHQALLYADGILNRTPAQSLEAHNREVAARALELFAAKYHGKRHHEFVIREIVHEVGKLRAGGGKG